MTQDEKKLLLRDLCARLPYGVKGMVSRRDHNNRECEFVKTIDGKDHGIVEVDVNESN